MYARSVEDLHQAAFARWTDRVTRRRHAPMALGPLASHLAPASTLGGFPGGCFLPRPPFTPGPRRWRHALAGSYAFDDFAVTGLSVNRYVFDLSDWTRSRWTAPLGPLATRLARITPIKLSTGPMWNSYLSCGIGRRLATGRRRLSAWCRHRKSKLSFQ